MARIPLASFLAVFIALGAWVGSRADDAASLLAGGATSLLRGTHAVPSGRTRIEALPFRVERSGSYYLAERLSGVPHEPGITVAASEVTIDLNGHVLEGCPESGPGISVHDGLGNVAIRNGTIRGWGEQGVAASDAPGVRVEGVVVEESGAAGLALGSQAFVRACSARSNRGAGMRVGAGSALHQCTAVGNGAEGIRGGRGTAVHASSAQENGGDGIRVEGGLVTQSLSRRNAGVGIRVRDSLLSRSAAHDNGDDIRAEGRSEVRESRAGL